MSYELKTRIKPALPRGNYTIVARLTDYADVPYSRAHADFLSDSLKSYPHQVQESEGAIFVAVATTNLEEAAVIRQSAEPLYRGLAQLALDPEIIAFVIPTSNLNPDRPLAESFPYLNEDVSLELRDELDSLKLQPAPANDVSFYFELEHLADL